MAADNHTYTTLKLPVEEMVVKERKSKFIGYAYPIDSEEQFNVLLNGLRQQHSNANHVCYAWQLGVREITYRVQDDGEPRNSAGMPIYGQIKSLGLTNIAVLVVRYFGGTKLGVGGLISAYREAARITLGQGTFTVRPITCGFFLEFSYEVMSNVLRLLEVVEAEIVSRELTEKARMHVRVPLARKEEFLSGIAPLRGIYLEEMNP